MDNPLGVRRGHHYSRVYALRPTVLRAVAALEHTGGFALLDILQPCPSFNRRNTFRWYKDRVRFIDPSHDPTDRMAAFNLAFAWGTQIPIGVYYKCDRPTFESQLHTLKSGSLVDVYNDESPA